MTTYYLMTYPDDWGIAPRLTQTRSEIVQVINDHIQNAPVEIDTVKLDRARDDLIEELWLKELENRKDHLHHAPYQRTYSSREDLAIQNQEMVERTIQQRVLDDQKKALIDRYCSLIQTIEMKSLDEEALSQLESIARQYGVPDIEFTDALRKRQADLEWEHHFKIFYKSASVTNSIARDSRGTAKLMREYPRMIRLRYYKGLDGEIRKTIEMELE